MTHDPLHQSISTFNFTYLSLLQRQLLTDKLQAIYAFGIEEGVAELLLSLSGADLLALSHSHRALCRLTLDDPERLQARLNAPAHLQDAHKAHAAILNLNPTFPGDSSDVRLWGNT